MTTRIRQTLILATLAAAVVAVAAGTYVRGFAQTPQPQVPAQPVADVILSNGKIITVDARFSIAQAVAIQGERILAVGTNQDINRLAGPATAPLAR